MRKRYTQPTAHTIEVAPSDILLSSTAKTLSLDEEAAEESKLSRFFWNDMQED